jgi:hypothetical protein
MKKILAVLIFFLIFANVAFAQVHVRGYYNSNGTYVQPHYRSSPDRNPYNNWSTQGNINPYTGQEGRRSYESFSYPSQQNTRNPMKTQNSWIQSNQ